MGIADIRAAFNAVDGTPFSIKSGLIASDLIATARETAKLLIDGPPTP